MTRRKPTSGALVASNNNNKAAAAAAWNMSQLDLPPNMLRPTCKAWCSCQCHSISDWHSRSSLQHLFGALSIRHSGFDRLTKPCNESHCRRTLAPKMSLRYRLPTSIANLQYLMCSFSSLAGPELRVKLPRVRDWTSPVWHHATSGDVEAVAGLFKHGLASPWDVSPVGGNLLHYATDHWNPQLCKLLLDADLDPEAADDFKSTAIGIAWERVLSGRMTADEASTVASLFANTDYLSTRSFSVIHKIVLGLVSKDLDYELECSSAEINKQDAAGRTPLSWAAARGDEPTVRILLHHKADPNISDIKGNHPLHYVRNTACARLLLDANADLHALNDERQHPLYMTCRNFEDPSLVKFLIDAGSDVNWQDASDQTAMHNVGGQERMQFVHTLLDAGADFNIRNNSGDTALRLAMIYNVHDVLRRMLRERPDACDFAGINHYGQSFAHAVVRTADVETVQILTDARPATFDLDLGLRDKAGKTAEEYLNERLDYLDDRDRADLRDVFEKLVIAVVVQPQSGEVHPVTEVGLEDKVDIVIRGREVSSLEEEDDAAAVEEVFYDTVEVI